MRQYKESDFHGDIFVTDYNVLEASAQKGDPSVFRIEDFLVIGPYVMKTGDTFEAEHLYDREKILHMDYLSLDGGERDIVPYLGLRGSNPVLGPQTLHWARGLKKWGMLRFDPDDGDAACDDALYLTKQRNCIFYAATYVRTERACRAVIVYENSGCQLFLNGELIRETPFGRIKGLPTMGEAVPAVFQKGLNLLLFKLRPGYICDTVDLSMTNCSIYPECFGNEALSVSEPTRTLLFDNGRQIFPFFVSAYADSQPCTLQIADRVFELPAMRQGESRLLRAKIPLSVCTAECTLPGASGRFFVRHDTPSTFQGEEHLMSSFHFDTTYHQEQRIYAMGAMYLTRELLRCMRENPDFTAVMSEVDYLHPYMTLYPEDRAFLRECFRKGRVEADSLYNQPSELTSTEEGLTRNFVYGQLYHRDVLGALCKIYSPGDVFGHFNQISQLCLRSECSGISWWKHILGLPPVFRHLSPDGTALVHKRGGISREIAVKQHFAVCDGSSSPLPTVPHFPFEADTSWMKEVHAKYSTPSVQHEALTSGKDAVIPLTSRDISLYHAGTSLTRTDLKEANRLCEELLVAAEKLCVMAGLCGAKYPERAFDKAWRQVLCGQHHDSVTGTNNEISFADLMIQYREAAEIAAGLAKNAARHLSAHIARGDGRTVVLFNTQAFDRTDPAVITLDAPADLSVCRLLDASGGEVPFEVISDTALRCIAKVPSMGFSALTLCTGIPAAAEAAASEETVIENDFLRVRVDPSRGGGIVSLFDKKAGREVINAQDSPANRLVALKETHNRMEPQHEFYTTGHQLTTEHASAQVSRKITPISETLTIRTELGNVARITQTLTLFKGSRRLECTTRVDDYRDEDDLLCVTFPTSMKGVKPVFDDRYGPQVRDESHYSMTFRTHQYAMASQCRVYPANRWMDYGPTVTLHLFDSGYEGSLNIGMSQIIRPDALSAQADALLTALTLKAIPVTPFPDGEQDPLTSQIIHFHEDLGADTRFVLHTPEHPNAYAAKLLADVDRPFGGGCTLWYRIDSNNLWQKPVDVLILCAESDDALTAWVQNFAERLANSSSLCLDARLCEVPHADDYGLAILNIGNIACSVEHGGLLNLMLFHTAEFYGNIGNTHSGHFVPEQKSHLFSYALYPHARSYREAEVNREALAYSDPIRGLEAAPANSIIFPSSHSFLQTNGSCVITAMKAGGNPSASLRDPDISLGERGITIRFYEPYGKPAKAVLRPGFAFSEAAETNILEEKPVKIALDGNALSLETGAHSIHTLHLTLSGACCETKKIGPEHEFVQPYALRTWEHDLGTMPMGYLDVACTIDRHPRFIDGTHVEIRVHLVNNRTDRDASGCAELILPHGWDADCRSFPYTLAAGAAQMRTVRVTMTEKCGVLYLLDTQNGQTLEDSLEIGSFDTDFSLTYANGKLSARIENLSGSPLHGMLGLASPIESWGSLFGSSHIALSESVPLYTPVKLAPHEIVVLHFDAPSDPEQVQWWIGKLMINGNISFSGTNNRCKHPHVLWAHEFIHDINKAGGSIRDLLTMH